MYFINTKPLMLFRDVIVAYSENHVQKIDHSIQCQINPVNALLISLRCCLLLLFHLVFTPPGSLSFLRFPTNVLYASLISELRICVTHLSLWSTELIYVLSKYSVTVS